MKDYEIERAMEIDALTEREAIYRINLGFSKLENIPDFLRTPDVCVAACTMDPKEYQYVPEKVKEQIPKDLADKCKKQQEKEIHPLPEERRKKKKRKVQEHELTEDELYQEDRINYRLQTGDLNEDGKRDWKDKKLEREGVTYLDI